MEPVSTISRLPSFVFGEGKQKGLDLRTTHSTKTRSLADNVRTRGKSTKNARKPVKNVYLCRVFGSFRERRRRTKKATILKTILIYKGIWKEIQKKTPRQRMGRKAQIALQILQIIATLIQLWTPVHQKTIVQLTVKEYNVFIKKGENWKR